MLLFDGGDAPLASFGTRLSDIAAQSLLDLGVELHMNSLVTDIDSNGVTVKTKDGSLVRHDAGIALWTAGVGAPPVAIGDRRGHRAPRPTGPAASRSATT